MLANCCANLAGRQKKDGISSVCGLIMAISHYFDSCIRPDAEGIVVVHDDLRRAILAGDDHVLLDYVLV